MRKVLLGILAAAGLAGATSAKAALYDISYMAGGETANIVLTTSDIADPNHPGGFDILGVSGMLGAAAITSLAPTSGPGVFTLAPVGSNPIEFDNVFYPTTPNFDTYGLLFTTTLDYYNLYFESGQYLQLTPEQRDADSFGDTVTAFSVAAAPESQTWILLILGFAGLGFVGYRRAASGGVARSVA